MNVAELKALNPNVNFIKTKYFVDKPNIQILKDAFIPDDDMKAFPENITEKTRIYPLSVTEYPGVLKRMTAMEAGAWAISKCRQQGWDLDYDNFQCCLSNLEMDYN